MKEVVQNSMLPLVIRMADDPVPNIRFNVAKTLHSLIKYLDSNVCHPIPAAFQPQPNTQQLAGCANESETLPLKALRRQGPGCEVLRCSGPECHLKGDWIVRHIITSSHKLYVLSNKLVQTLVGLEWMHQDKQP